MTQTEPHSPIPTSTSAKDEQALLLFTLGPVQVFIAAARRTADLWAGSYLLSYLARQALDVLRERIDRDAILFPYEGTSEQLNAANIPNRFFAVVPAAHAEALAEEAAAAVTRALTEAGQIALKKAGMPDNDYLRRLAEAQLNQFAECYWAALPIPDLSAPDLLKQVEERYSDFYSWEEDGSSAQGDQAYGRLYRITEGLVGVRKALRDFERLSVKLEPGYRDSLMPTLAALVENPIARPKAIDRFWDDLSSRNRARIRKGERLSAVSLAKRYLPDILKLEESAFPSTSSFAVADFKADVLKECPANQDLRAAVEKYVSACKPLREQVGLEAAIPRLKEDAENLGLAEFVRISGEWLFEDGLSADSLQREGIALSDGDRKDLLDARKNLIRTAGKAGIDPPSKYYALFLFDGDRMGGWLSGEIEPGGGPKGLTSADRHRSISQALGHFAGHHALRIVEKQYLGRLVYSGGDDVMAFVSLHDALPAARLLRAAFSGQINGENRPDWTLKTAFGEEGGGGGLTMGHKATGSAGLVLAHHLQPLQQVLAGARRAEKIAKDGLGRNALALHVMKRSGETIEAGAKWFAEGDPPVDLIEPARAFAELVRTGKVATGYVRDLDDLRRRLCDEQGKSLLPKDAFCTEALRLFTRRAERIHEADRAAAFQETVSALLEHLGFAQVVRLLDAAQFIAQGGNL